MAKHGRNMSSLSTQYTQHYHSSVWQTHLPSIYTSKHNDYDEPEDEAIDWLNAYGSRLTKCNLMKCNEEL